jgi:hypothetical protein
MTLKDAMHLKFAGEIDYHTKPICYGQGSFTSVPEEE